MSEGIHFRRALVLGLVISALLIGVGFWQSITMGIVCLVGCGALLAIIANSTDTNLIARSDRATQLAVVEELKALLARTPYPDEAALRARDDRFIAANLSPGGSADLLALCYLLHFFKTEVLEDV